MTNPNHTNTKQQPRSPNGQWIKEATPFLNRADLQLSNNDSDSIALIKSGFDSGKYDDQIIETLEMNGIENVRKRWDRSERFRVAMRDYFSHRFGDELHR